MHRKVTVKRVLTTYLMANHFSLLCASFQSELQGHQPKGTECSTERTNPTEGLTLQPSTGEKPRTARVHQGQTTITQQGLVRKGRHAEGKTARSPGQQRPGDCWDRLGLTGTKCSGSVSHVSRGKGLLRCK